MMKRIPLTKDDHWSCPKGCPRDRLRFDGRTHSCLDCVNQASRDRRAKRQGKIPTNPLDEYSSAEKEFSRLEVFGHLNKVKDLQVLLLPGPRMTEVALYLAHGIPIDRIIAVEQEPKLAARIAERYPGLKIYVQRLTDAIVSMSDEGITINAGHLDLMTSVNNVETINSIKRLFRCSVFTRPGRLVVNMVNGHDNKEARELALMDTFHKLKLEGARLLETKTYNHMRWEAWEIP